MKTELYFVSDYTTIDGEVHGRPADASSFEYGERYVACRGCGLKRPGKEMKLHAQGYPVCKDGCRTVVPNS